jgi:hypothetical protein
MKILDTDNHAVGLHEIYITIDVSELYAEIIEVYKESRNGHGFVVITSVTASESEPGNQKDINTDFRSLEP